MQRTVLKVEDEECGCRSRILAERSVLRKTILLRQIFEGARGFRSWPFHFEWRKVDGIVQFPLGWGSFDPEIDQSVSVIINIIQR